MGGGRSLSAGAYYAPTTIYCLRLGLRGNPGTANRSRARTAGGMALGCTGILVLLSLVAMPAQYLFTGPGTPSSMPTRAIAQALAQRPTRTPRQTVEPSPIPAQPISQDDGGNAPVERPLAPLSPTDTPKPTPTATASPTSTNTPTPTLTPSPAPTSTPEPTPTFTPTPSPTPLPVARVTPLTGTSAVNIRFGPGLGYAVVGVLRQGEFITVTGAVENRGWWRVDLNGKPAWVSARVVRMDGDGQSVEIVPAAEIPRLPPQPPATVQPTAAPGN